MIVTFGDKDTQKLHQGKYVKRFDQIAMQARRRLVILDAASELKDLEIPPGNKLEALKGDRAGQYSIRINDQYRICFIWKEGNAEDA